MQARQLARAVEAQLAELLRHGGGGGTSGGVTDDWKKSVDDQLGRLHGDIRSLLRGTIAGALFIVTAIIGLYVYTGTKTDALNDRIGRVEQQQARMDGKLDLLLERSTSRHAARPDG